MVNAHPAAGQRKPLVQLGLDSPTIGSGLVADWSLESCNKLIKTVTIVTHLWNHDQLVDLSHPVLGVAWKIKGPRL